MHFNGIIVYSFHQSLRTNLRTLAFILLSKTNPIRSKTSKGPFWNYLHTLRVLHYDNRQCRNIFSCQNGMNPSKEINAAKDFQTLFWVTGKNENKTGIAKWTSHSLWISTQYGWLSTQEPVSKSPENKHICLMNVNVFACAIHSDSQWLMCGATGHNENITKI